MKRSILICTLLMVGVLTACSPQPLQTIGADKYYVQISGDGEENGNDEHTRYEYTLDGIDKSGESKSLSFTAGKQLKEDAYLKIYYKKDEVITFEEVESDDIPDKALQVLEADEDN